MAGSKQQKRFKTITLGCKVNQCESSAISHRLSQHGLAPVAPDGPADICIINTCAVTGKAAMQSRQAVRRAARENPEAKIIVTGCYAQISPDIFHQMETPLEVVPQDRKGHILQDLLISEKELPNSKGVLFPKPDDFDSDSTLDRTRPTLKIQDGCNAFCTYCIVPYARGRSCSMEPSDVLANLFALEESGFHEVVLTGIHLGHFGRDLTPTQTFSGLLDQITQSSLHLRIRLSSIEPRELTDQIIDQVAADNRFCNHFHVPLQSGATSILKRMGRPYTAEEYARRIEQVVRRIPEAGIGADVMVGFPGETDADFEQCYERVKSLPVTYLHVFPFSPRAGTPAANYPDQVQDAVMKERAARMRELGQTKRIAFYAGQIGRIASVLVEGRRDRKSGLLKGMSDNYIPVLIKGEDTLMNQVVQVRLYNGTEAGHLAGVVEDQ